MELLLKQYDYVRRTRENLFSYCEKIADAEYLTEVKQFGRGSIRATHLHVAGCYAFWLGEFSMQRPCVWREESIVNLTEMRGVFKKVDSLVFDFLERFAQKMDLSIEGQFHGQKFAATPIWLFTHTVTHEFHHKGQIATMGRMIGYVPPDLDLIKTDGLKANS